jgi:hypothetical protein
MAQNINAYSTNGLFKANAIALSEVTEAVFSADLSDAKDSITVIVDTTASSASDIVLSCMPSEAGYGEVRVPLTAKSLNVVNITTKGIKKNDGFGEFKFVNTNGASLGQQGIKICFVKYSPVINH